MKKFGCIATILLSIITCGIYWIYVLYHVKENFNRLSSEQVPGLIKMALLSMVTFGIYGIWWWYKLFKVGTGVGNSLGVQTISGDAVVLFLLSLFIPFVIYYTVTDLNNKVVTASGY